MRRVCTYVHRNYDFKNIREYHGAFIGAAERTSAWNIDISELASQCLHMQNNSNCNRSQVVKNQVVYIQKDTVTEPQVTSSSIHFCLLYNAKRCGHKTTHTGLIAGEVKWCQHICATCWLDYSETQKHPEADCTRPSLRRRRRYVGNLSVATGVLPPETQQ